MYFSRIFTWLFPCRPINRPEQHRVRICSRSSHDMASSSSKAKAFTSFGSASFKSLIPRAIVAKPDPQRSRDLSPKTAGIICGISLFILCMGLLFFQIRRKGCGSRSKQHPNNTDPSTRGSVLRAPPVNNEAGESASNATTIHEPSPGTTIPSSPLVPSSIVAKGNKG